MASVFKVPVIVTLYRHVEKGRIALDEKIEMTSYARVSGSGILKELTPEVGDVRQGLQDVNDDDK